jgi:3',5'-cyclic AMP phosphodiesterase CpdA
VGLNSSCTTRIFSAAGELGPKQLNRLDEHLATDRVDQNYQVVLIHHPPLPGLAQRRKALRDDRALRELLVKHSPDLVLYGHLHRDREHSLGNTRIYCTASASSAKGASYRVFDLEPNDSGWHCRMRLMSLPADADHHCDPVKSLEESWSVRR